MHCKSCDYPLWNIKARQCPECGAPFAPSEFEFVANRVRYCCPECEQEYYGTGDKGHLKPREFECVTCGNRITMDEMILRPTEGFTESQTRPGRVPWLERRSRGFWRSFFCTVGYGLGAPQKLMKGLPDDAPLGEAVLFMLLVLALTLSVGLGLPYAWYSVDAYLSWGGIEGYEIAWEIHVLLLSTGVILGLCLGWPITAHALLCLTGGGEPRLERTFQAFCYTAGACAAGIIPCAGPFIGMTWWMIIFGVALTAVHRVNPGRSVVAVVALPLIVAGSYISAMIIEDSVDVIPFGSNAYQPWSPTPAAGPPAGLTEPAYLGALSAALRDWGDAHEGDGPGHVVVFSFLDESTIEWPGGARFCAEGSATAPDDIPVGDHTLGGLEDLDLSEQLGAMAACIECVDEDVIAYRFGDFIFTYPGVDLREYQTGLWIAVQLPDPEVNAPFNGNEVFWAVLCCDREPYTIDELPLEIDMQNTLRADFGLPPLPDLMTITHESPAVSGGDAD